MEKLHLLEAGEALLIVDMQNCFLPGGTLGITGSDRILDPVNRLIRIFAKRKFPVALSRDWHPPDHISFQQQGGPWPVHGVAGTPDAAFSPALHYPADAAVFSKAMGKDQEEYSAFLASDAKGLTLREWLEQNQAKRIWIGGLATDYCVLNTGLDLRKAGFGVIVLRDAVHAVDVTPGDGERALAEMAARGAKIAAVSEIEDKS